MHFKRFEKRRSFCHVISILIWWNKTKAHRIVIWWRHQMETFSALLAICAGNSLVTREFTSQRPVTRTFDVFFDLRLNKRLSKQSWGWWVEMPSRPLWRHSNVLSFLSLHWLFTQSFIQMQIKKIAKLRVTGLCAGIRRRPVNSPHKWPVTRKNVFIWWRHHVISKLLTRRRFSSGVALVRYMKRRVNWKESLRGLFAYSYYVARHGFANDCPWGIFFRKEPY